MIIESLNEYLETVAEYIFDDDKLVTYKWLSKNLEIHVNVAKQILWEFWQRHKEEKNFVCVFLLMGTLHDGGMRVEVVKEENLLKAKEKFSNIISEHVYSLQKVLPDIQALSLSENGDTKYGAIKCKECVERSEEEMHMLRWGALSSEIQQQQQLTSSDDTRQEKSATSPKKNSIDAKKDATKKGFNNLFGKVNSEPKSSASVSSEAEKVEAKTSNGTKKISPKRSGAESLKKKPQKNGLYGFFEQNKNQEKVTKPQSPEIKEIQNTTEKKEKIEEKTSEKKNQQKSIRGKKRNRSKEATIDVSKKRKRIVVQNDSSDTGSSNEEEEEEEIEEPEPSPSPVKQCSPPPPPVVHEGGRRRVLKMVDKTFEEDGYLVTKKVHVYESCSENEEEETKKSEMSERQKEPKEKKNTKQTTLMSFFKKS